MSLRRKLTVLADAAKYDASCASGGRRGEARDPERLGVCHSYTPDGRCVSLLKLLLTNHCIYDCQYCVNRASSDVARERLTVDEVVWLTLELHRRNYVEGLFLSSGIVKSPDHTMAELVAVARTLRVEHGFRGYVHLKAIPGASPDLIAEAGRYADRISANVELPSQADLDRLAPEKRLVDVEAVMQVVRARREAEPGFAPAGHSTQLIVGATPSSDAQILALSQRLYREHGLARVYYTAYSPIEHADARLPAKPPPLAREHRIYQADYLVRRYGFDAEELVAEGDLDPRVDPKLAWALGHRARFPVDLQRAPRDALLRVPGIGPRSVKRILAARRQRALRLADLPKLGVVLERARPFVVAVDHHPDARAIDRLDLRERIGAEQLSLFAPVPSALEGDG